MSTPKVGDRIDGMEWTGDAWAPVCPRCDRPMDAHEKGPLAWLCCGTCGLRAVDR